jgi:hypothetical protein
VNRRDWLGWFRRPVSPELGLLIWTGASFWLAYAERRHGGWIHFSIGLVLYALFRVHRWRAAAIWKIQVVLALALLVIGAHAFLSPWARWHWSMSYWLIYNQTYRWNYDASLRVAWVPCVAVGWGLFAWVGGLLDQRRRRARGRA